MKHVRLHIGFPVVINLTKPYLGKGKTITTDNFFTSYCLAKQLQQKKTSILGMVNKVTRELPQSAKATPYSSVLIKADGVITLSIYQCKPKSMCALSSLCMPVDANLSEKRKSQTIEFYNKTKCEVNVEDQMA